MTPDTSHAERVRAPDGGRTVHYEETLGMRDEEGAGGYIKGTWLSLLAMIVFTIVGFGVVAFVAIQSFAAEVGGMDVARSILGQMWAQQPLPIVLAGLFVVLLGVYFVTAIVGSVRGLRRELDKQVHVQVTNTGVLVDRNGSRRFRSSGVEIPFDAITAVEYLDREASTFRVELGDWRAPKFFAGRSRRWIRLERNGGAAVYVGSDDPKKLADAIARRVPGPVTAEPY